MPSTSQLRVGVAGYGLSGAVFHTPLIATVDGLIVAAILTSSPERAAQAAAAHPAARVVADAAELMEDIDEIGRASCRERV